MVLFKKLAAVFSFLLSLVALVFGIVMLCQEVPKASLFQCVFYGLFFLFLFLFFLFLGILCVVLRVAPFQEKQVRPEAEGKAELEAVEKARREAATMTHLVISRDVTVIEDHLYSRCDTFQSVTVGEWVTRVGRYAFSNCVRLRRAELKCGITHLEKGTFAGCSMLESITLPATLTVIDGYVFAGCRNLSEIRFCGTVAQWNAIEKQDSWWDGGEGCKVVCSDSAV